MNSIFTLSNFLSFSRVIILIPFFHYLSLNTATGNYWALFWAMVGMLTDFLDGRAARKFNTVTTLGKYLDPIADKICILSAAIYLTYYRGTLPAWFTWLLIAKDLLLIIGGGYILFKKKIVFQADLSGKWTVFIVALVFGCYILDYTTLGIWFLYASLVLVLYSTAHYVKKFVPVLKFWQ